MCVVFYRNVVDVARPSVWKKWERKRKENEKDRKNGEEIKGRKIFKTGKMGCLKISIGKREIV